MRTYPVNGFALDIQYSLRWKVEAYCNDPPRGNFVDGLPRAAIYGTRIRAVWSKLIY